MELALRYNVPASCIMPRGRFLSQPKAHCNMHQHGKGRKCTCSAAPKGHVGDCRQGQRGGAHLQSELVEEDDGAVAFRGVCGQLAQSLAHEAGLRPHCGPQPPDMNFHVLWKADRLNVVECYISTSPPTKAISHPTRSTALWYPCSESLAATWKPASATCRTPEGWPSGGMRGAALDRFDWEWLSTLFAVPSLDLQCVGGGGRASGNCGPCWGGKREGRWQEGRLLAPCFLLPAHY